MPFTFVDLFAFRPAAVWWAWEEPMARVHGKRMEGEPERERLKNEMKPDLESDLG